MQDLHIETALMFFLHQGCLRKYYFYLLNTSFNAFAGKNFTFCEAAI